ncbi:ferredoxin reductase [Pseudofrankia sp. BMG5.36]|uniref:ferredoxin reductase n=1 Tax=Pseudofrankia sp. BMG5.36 TaxID=1834512 RepID=UPI0008DAE201|nr:ferredoxin reductase [Pseudofrankia sp. BMG5.36]OHV74702.1 stearoyl-CoA 9-desaturase [Pseudofrankia sp. BMG5.36]
MAVGRILLDAAASLTTPLLPDDYLGLVDPLWSRRGSRGRVVAVHPEAAGAASLVIRPGAGWKEHRAGQYVRVGVAVDGVWHWRPYSVSSAPGDPGGVVSITVKSVPGGRLSQHLVERVRPGAVVRLEHPQGRFVLPRAIPPRLLFVTAGSGITPVMSMLRSLALRGEMPDVVLVHSAPSRDDVIFGSELRDLAARFPTLRLYEHHTRAGGRYAGRLTAAALPVICPDWAERPTWACGPPGLLADAEARWCHAGIADRLRVERFHPAPAPGGGGGAGGRVRFTRSGRQAHTHGDTPLLAVGEDAGVLMPSGCRMGICHSCMARLTSGRVRDLRTGREYGDEGDLVQTCVSTAVGDVEIDV